VSRLDDYARDLRCQVNWLRQHHRTLEQGLKHLEDKRERERLGTILIQLEASKIVGNDDLAWALATCRRALS